MNGLPENIFQRWRHSFEEDTADVEVYRPETYDFPRARGRGGIEFRPNGRFIRLAVGRGDATQEVAGNWHITGPEQLTITYPGGERQRQVLEIVQCSQDILKVRWQQAPP